MFAWGQAWQLQQAALFGVYSQNKNKVEVHCNICRRKLVFKDLSTSFMMKRAKHYSERVYNDHKNILVVKGNNNNNN